MSKPLYVRVSDDVHGVLSKLAKTNDRPLTKVAAQLLAVGVEVLQERGEVAVPGARLRAPGARR